MSDSQRGWLEIQEGLNFKVVLLAKNLQTSFPFTKVLSLLVSLYVCWGTQKRQSMRWSLGGCVEVKNVLGSREAASRELLCRKRVGGTVCTKVFFRNTG